MTAPTITSVTINSVNLDLDDVILDVIVTHGRGAITDAASPSTLDMRIFATGQITVPYTLGQSVNVKADTRSRVVRGSIRLGPVHNYGRLAEPIPRPLQTAVGILFVESLDPFAYLYVILTAHSGPPHAWQRSRLTIVIPSLRRPAMT